MQIRIFAIPLLGGEALTEDMNVFLRSKKVIQVKDQLIMQGEEGAFWCFCVRYVDDVAAAEREKGQKIDYRKVLDPVTFERFSALRAIRKQVAQDDGVMPYVVFYDAELAEMAKMETITPEGMKKIKGIGEKKVEKYGHFFLSLPQVEAMPSDNTPTDTTDEKGR